MTFHSTSLSNPTRPCPAHQECALKLGEPTYPVKIHGLLSAACQWAGCLSTPSHRIFVSSVCYPIPLVARPLACAAASIRMALRSPELRFAASTGLGALSRPSRLAPSPLAALASPRRRRRGPSPSPSPSPSDSNPSTASAGKSAPLLAYSPLV